MALPKKVTVSEVGPRDGLQIEARHVPTAVKIELIERLVAAGIDRIEASSFVHAKVVPQLADAEQVFAGLTRKPGVRYGALVFNAKGAARALAAGVDDLKTGLAASDTFNELNIRMSTEQGMRALDEIAAMAKGTQVRLVGGIATAFGCPYEGEISRARLHQLFGQLVDYGAPLIYLADTTGVADPAAVRRTLEDLGRDWPNQRIGLHLHNTRGLGLANALAAYEEGVRSFDSSLGGLGGCPFAPGASGNVITEDLVFMFEAMGVSTGIDLDKLMAARRIMVEVLPQEQTYGHFALAGVPKGFRAAA